MKIFKKNIYQIGYGSLRRVIDEEALKKHNIRAFYTKFRK